MSTKKYNNELLIKNGHICDPSTDTYQVQDLGIKGGIFTNPEDLINPQIVDATGLTIMPGLIDIHVHLREPGNENKETIATGTAAAAAGGFTTIVAMPNTSPAPDSPEHINEIQQLIQENAQIKVLICGSMTTAGKGDTPVDINSLKNAGAIAFSDDGTCPQNSQVMDKIIQQISKTKTPIIEHAEDMELSQTGVMHKGIIAKKLNLPGKSGESETKLIERDIQLIKKYGGKLHVQHISTAEGAALVEEAQKGGLAVTAELTPHHLILTDAAVAVHGTNAKMNPPLRTADDREKLIEALQKNVISIIATDHAPHTQQEKTGTVKSAPNGITGLEAALGVALTELYHRRNWSLTEIIEKVTSKPAELLGLKTGSLQQGIPADFILVDTEYEWRYSSSKTLSKAKNCPYENMIFKGKNIATYLNGKLLYKDEDYFNHSGERL